MHRSLHHRTELKLTVFLNPRPVRSLVVFAALLAHVASVEAQTGELVYEAICRPAPVALSGQILVPSDFFQEAIGARWQSLTPDRFRLSHFANSIEFTLKSREALINGSAVELPESPLALNGYVYVPVDVVAQAFGIPMVMQSRTDEQAIFQIATTPVRVLNARSSAAAEHVRVVLEIDRPVAFKRERDSSVALQIPGRTDETLPPSTSLMDGLVSQVGYTNSTTDPASTRWLIHCNYPVPVEVSTLTEPFRIIVDCKRLFEESARKEIAPGITYKWFRRGTPNGPLNIYCTEIDLRDSKWELVPALVPNGMGFGNDPLSAIAARARAMVAINGGYFVVGSGVSVGALMKDGEWIRPPINRRSSLCMARDGRLFIENLGLKTALRFGESEPLTVTELNPSQPKNGLTLYTPAWHGSVAAQPGEWMAVVIAGKVVAIIQSVAAIPSDAYVVLARGATALRLANSVREGDPAEVKFETIPAGLELRHVIGAGPRLLYGGRTFVSSEAELFTSKLFTHNVPESRAPRSALGLTPDGKLLLVVIDGRRPYFSIGTTLWETADIMRKLGAREAMNLDGGGSSTLVIAGQVVNRPSDGQERKVTNGLVIRERMPMASGEQ